MRIVQNFKMFSMFFFICAQPQTFKSVTLSECYSTAVLIYSSPSLLPVYLLRPAVYLTSHVSFSPLLPHPPIPWGVFDGLMLLSRPPSCVRLQRREVTVSIKL